MRAKAMAVLAVPLIALVGTTAAGLVLEHDERALRATGLKASMLVSASGQVLADALNSETGVRGYVATGDPVFLAPYDDALARIGADRGAFKAAAAARGAAGSEEAVDDAVGSVLAGLAGLKADVSHGAAPGSLDKPLRQGKADMDRLRGLIARLDQGPEAELLGRREAINGLEDGIGGLDIAGMVLGVLAAAGGLALFTGGISRRVEAAAANAERLGQGRPLVPVAPARDELGRLAGALVKAGELLDSRASDLTAARDEAVNATEAKNKFLSATSHELRTPLNSILGFTQLLELSVLDDEEDRDSVQRILSAGRHLLALINELIDIARIESGDLSLSLEPVGVVPLITEAARLMEPLAAERSVQIHCPTGQATLAACADRQRFSQILVNLISNAIKYNRLGGTVTITCQDTPDRVSVIVTDSGHGIGAEDLERIFVPFERLGAERTEIEGTGIGLPLARTLAEAMGGQLTVTSLIHSGSAFTIQLPRAADLPTPSAADTPGLEPDPTLSEPEYIGPDGGLQVLYIEDNPANVEVVGRYLRNRSTATLASCPTGRDGLKYAMTHKLDLILLDLHLQDGHGEQTLGQLKAEPITAAIPVVVLSADASHGMIKRLIAHGALAYLTKPLNLADLGSILDSLPVQPPEIPQQPGPAEPQAIPPHSERLRPPEILL